MKRVNHFFEQEWISTACFPIVRASYIVNNFEHVWGVQGSVQWDPSWTSLITPGGRDGPCAWGEGELGPCTLQGLGPLQGPVRRWTRTRDTTPHPPPPPMDRMSSFRICKISLFSLSLFSICTKKLATLLAYDVKRLLSPLVPFTGCVGLIPDCTFWLWSLIMNGSFPLPFSPSWVTMKECTHLLIRAHHLVDVKFKTKGH